MIDIYDELGYIKNVLTDGLSQKWERDVTLLVRYYKDYEKWKPAKIKTEIKSRCLQAASRADDPITYKPLMEYERLNKIVSSALKKTVPLRTIKSVSFPREVLDWFLSLESYTITQEKQDWLKSRRPSLSIKNLHPLTWNRIKYLFTLYIWTLIQANYLERPNMHYLNQYGKRFKSDAALPPGFNLSKERDLLNDLEFIRVNRAQGIDVIFLENPVFQTPVTDDNRITIEISEETTVSNNKTYFIESGDLHNPGYWLDKQKFGTFICQECGKEFAHYGTSKNECRRKYCKECADKLKNHTTKAKYTTIKCIDCGREVQISNKDHKSVRCCSCQDRYNRERKSNWANKKTQQSDFTILGEPLDL